MNLNNSGHNNANYNGSYENGGYPNDRNPNSSYPNGGYRNSSNMNMKFFLHKCPNCSAPIRVTHGMTSATCEYCGYTSLISPSEMEQIENRKVAKSSSRKSNIILIVVLIPVLLVFFGCTCFAFVDGYKMPGILGAIQCACIIGALMAGIGRKVSGLRIALTTVLIITSFMLVFPFFGTMFSEDRGKAKQRKTENDFENYISVDTTWPSNGIGRVTPKPELEEADIWENTEKTLSLRAANIAEEFFETYQQECIKAGYTENAKEYNTNYEAYTKEGYHIKMFLTDEKEFYLTVEAPIEMKHYLWPESGVGTLLPEPDNEYGKINEDRNRSFRAEIYQVSEEDFEDYIEALKDAGFTVNASQRMNAYDAYDKEGNWIDLFLFDDFYHTLLISAEAPGED